MTYLSYVVNTMAADDLATKGARASAAMVLTSFTGNILASAPESEINSLILGALFANMN